MFPTLVRSQDQTKAIISFPFWDACCVGTLIVWLPHWFTTIDPHVASSLFQSSLAIATKVFDVL